MILFGIRSPITVDYEETCLRLGQEISMGVSVEGAPRCGMPREKVVLLDDFDASAHSGKLFIACAFMPRRRVSLTI